MEASTLIDNITPALNIESGNLIFYDVTNSYCIVLEVEKYFYKQNCDKDNFRYELILLTEKGQIRWADIGASKINEKIILVS